MRPWVRGVAAVSMCTWLLSGCLAQLLWLHVEAEHLGQQHRHESHGGMALLLHPEGEREHEHQLSSAVGLPVLPGSRPQAQPPTLAVLADHWWVSPQQALNRPAPGPRPRGSPSTLERSTILLI